MTVYGGSIDIEPMSVDPRLFLESFRPAYIAPPGGTYGGRNPDGSRDSWVWTPFGNGVEVPFNVPTAFYSLSPPGGMYFLGTSLVDLPPDSITVTKVYVFMRLFSLTPLAPLPTVSVVFTDGPGLTGSAPGTWDLDSSVMMGNIMPKGPFEFASLQGELWPHAVVPMAGDLNGWYASLYSILTSTPSSFGITPVGGAATVSLTDIGDDTMVASPQLAIYYKSSGSLEVGPGGAHFYVART